MDTFREEGIKVHSKLDFKYFDGPDPSVKIRGVYAKGNIKNGSGASLLSFCVSLRSFLIFTTPIVFVTRHFVQGRASCTFRKAPSCINRRCDPQSRIKTKCSVANAPSSCIARGFPSHWILSLTSKALTTPFSQFSSHSKCSI
jgi:hypothetical protein